MDLLKIVYKEILGVITVFAITGFSLKTEFGYLDKTTNYFNLCNSPNGGWVFDKDSGEALCNSFILLILLATFVLIAITLFVIISYKIFKYFKAKYYTNESLWN